MKPVLSALACAVAFLPAFALAQQDAPASDPAPLPHQVGLIDMTHVFKHSHRFHALMENLQEEIEKTDQDAKLIVDRIRKLQAELNQARLNDGANITSLEEQLIKTKTELESFKRTAQQSFLRKEADIYKDVYLEVEESVRKYATYYKYTLIYRFEREDLSNQDDPQQLMNAMNRQVIHYQPQDDITDPILKYLNSQWEKQHPDSASRNKSESDTADGSAPRTEKPFRFRSGGVEITR